MTMTSVGIDAGGTLTKLAYIRDGRMHYQKFATADIAQSLPLMRAELDAAKLCVTGGKAHVIQKQFEKQISEVAEFDATCAGVRHLTQTQKIPLAGPFILANVGTGTSIHYVDAQEQKRVIGSGVGGGTLVGLGYQMLGTDDFKELTRLAESGDRAHVDLQVKDIYLATVSPLAGSLTASNFGKAAGTDASRADLAAAVSSMVAETVMLLSVQAAHYWATSSIVYIGSTFSDNPALQDKIEGATQRVGITPYFLQHGEMSGALGALLSIS